MKPKRSSKAFSSIRIIGKKAQAMLTKARDSLAKQEKPVIKKLPKKKQYQEFVMHLSTKSIAQATVTILCVILAAWLLYHLRHRIFLLLLAAFVATLMDPGVKKLEEWRVPRGIGIIIHYLFAILIVLFLLLSLIPTIAIQIQEIGRVISRDLTPFMENPNIQLPFLSPEINHQLSILAQTTLQNLSFDQFSSSLVQAGQELSDVASESVRFAARVAGSVVNFVVSFVIVLVLAFFMQMERERIVKWLRSFVPHKARQYADLKTDAIHTKIGQWMRGELMLMFSIFCLTFVALMILGMKDYALTLAVLAGFCELIPAVGPFFAAIPAVLIAGTQKGLIWIPVLAGVYYVIQWCENNLLVPLIMKRAVGLSPVAILFAMMVGISFPDTIHPILGVMLAVPTTTIIALFLEDWRESKGDDD